MFDYTKENKITIVISVLALFNIILHLAVSPNLEYHRDELLYFSLGAHPAAGYATVPPMIGWIAWLMQTLFGNSLLAVRLFPAAAGGLMVFLTAAVAKELGGSGYARILAGTGLIISGFGMRTFLLFQPVHIDLFFWTLSFYLIIKYINSSDDKYLIMFGAAAGFALLNKYLIGLLFILFLVVVPFTPYRNVLRNRKFWYGILAGSLIFLPNIIWQIANGLPVINHLADLNRTQLVNVDRGSFLFDQLIHPFMATTLTVAGLIYFFFNRDGSKYRFPGIVAVLVILALMLMQGKSYYTIGIFPLLIAAGAVLWSRILARVWGKVIFICMLILLTIPGIPFGLPVYKPERLVKYFKDLEDKRGIIVGREFEDGTIHSLPQDYADMLGWEELTLITSKAWQTIPDKSSAFIYCENYGQAGAISVIGKRYGLPEAISFHESFKYWIPEKFEEGINAIIYINDEMGDDVRALFKKITIAGSISNPHAREYGTTVYICENPASDFGLFWKERVKQIF